MKRDKLTKEVIDIIISYWKEGIMYKDIVTITGLSKSTVYRAIKMSK